MTKSSTPSAVAIRYDDVWLVDGLRTGFADYNSTLAKVSPTDLGIAVARALLAKGPLSATDIDAVIATNMAQASFDAYYLPRHIGLYAGVPQAVPAIFVHRLCGSGFETLIQAADNIQLGKLQLALCVGTESMSRNPVAAYTHREGFRMGQVEFKDFLWESLSDPAPQMAMGVTAENLARQYAITRADVDAYAARSFAGASAAREAGFFAAEITPLTSREFELEGYAARSIRLPRGVKSFAVDEHVKDTPLTVLEKLRPVFGGVQTGGNSSAIVDGAAACLVAAGDYARQKALQPLARIVATSAVGVPPEVMGIGPVPAICAVLEKTGLDLADIDRFEINEAFAAQYLAVERELGLDRNKVNVNGGAIAIGHPLAATGLRCTLTLARELQAQGLRYGISSACCGGGQGVAVLIENVSIQVPKTNHASHDH